MLKIIALVILAALGALILGLLIWTSIGPRERREYKGIRPQNWAGRPYD